MDFTAAFAVKSIEPQAPVFLVDIKPDPVYKHMPSVSNVPADWSNPRFLGIATTSVEARNMGSILINGLFKIPIYTNSTQSHFEEQDQWLVLKKNPKVKIGFIVHNEKMFGADGECTLHSVMIMPWVNYLTMEVELAEREKSKLASEFAEKCIKSIRTTGATVTESQLENLIQTEFKTVLNEMTRKIQKQIL